ncbi:fibronectin type III domain-containing protein [Microbacterium sp. Root61]|uniref:fibronectin type III domain-containing protein n=1 Tax=Microbacterium sp. Root61 TaxID=1736570 RepID=UPI000A5C06D0|nr:fibronectin type III domain-containing protein [Microbacterium sp. Root61]
MPRIARPALITAGALAVAIGLSTMGGGVAVAAGGGLAPPAIDPATVHRPTAVPDRVILTPTVSPAISQSVTWRTSDAVTAPQAQWAPSGPSVISGAQTVAAASDVAFDVSLGYRVAHHTATIEGLQPGTTYVYRVGDGETWSEWLEFTTAEESSGGFSFLVQGDAQNDNKAYTSRSFRAAFESRPYARLVVHAGDLIDTATSDAEWGEWHEAAAFSNQYLNVVASTGNHEYYPGPDLSQHWQAQFEYPLNGPAGQATLNETVYYVDYQGVRFISLDSSQAMGAASRAAQTEWLDAVLEENPNQWSVVSFHHPIFSVTSGRDNAALRDAWLPIFEEHDVDLVVQGHDHAYGRGNLKANEQNLPEGADPATSHTGPAYLVSVAGPKMYVPDPAGANNWTDNDANLRVVGRDIQLFQTVDVTEDGRMHVEARTVDGAKYDAFTITKDDAGNKLVTDDVLWAGGPGSSRDGVAPPTKPGTGPGEPGTGEPGTGEPGTGEPGEDKPSLSLGDSTVSAGGSLTLTGAGFLPDERVSIVLHSTPVTLALVTASDTGAIAATVTIPHDVEPGEHTLVVTGLESELSASAGLIITRAPSSGTLPATGSDLPIGLMAIGATLAAGGGILLTRTFLRNRKAS